MSEIRKNRGRKRVITDFKYRPHSEYYDELASKHKSIYVHSLAKNMLKERNEKYSCVNDDTLVKDVDVLPPNERTAIFVYVC